MNSGTCSHKQVLAALRGLGDPVKAAHSRRFFKTGPGEYGEGDRFLGIRMPVLRQQVKVFRELPHEEVLSLLQSRYHEARLMAVLVWAEQFRRGSVRQRKVIVDGYLANTAFINNWDIVDASAHLILGAWLEGKPHDVLRKLARSPVLWERRIAMMSCLHFIRRGEFETPLSVAALLLHDREDLIHKVVGWMLREIGNRDRGVEEMFLRQHYPAMPRTMLRYAIEKLPASRRKAYLNGSV